MISIHLTKSFCIVSLIILQFDNPIPSVPSIFVTLHKQSRNENDNFDGLGVADTYLLPGVVESPINHPLKDKTLKLKMKWLKLRILLKAVTRFQAPPGRSMSDPELNNLFAKDPADHAHERTHSTWSI